ncbi:ankyrin-3-like isoform X1 [Haliotis rufescens]|uniref:ankyrin-3-like isoform X1 n=2 Tax=Haliotis rufescens TaxID=6454 RepID=UPI00201F5D03|nr:ankyrin-3-like isoform X1 [Haliotis rufescens]XP_048245215.1 ankyrin-3-like isoform X1 [Haliotis rufescens]
MGQAASKQEEFWEACGFGRPHIVRHFIQEGIDVNWRSYTHDCCPIHVASQGKPEIVQLLLEAKCDVNVTDIRGNTALHHAAMKGHADIMETLIKAGTQLDAQDKNGWTALHNACYWCYPAAVKVLIHHGCDVHLANKDNRTALHETARSKGTDDRKLSAITEQLVTAGSDVNAKGSDLGEVDFTSLMFASYHGHPEVATVLIEAGCHLNDCGSNWWTSLHWAADRGQEELVYILLEAGADPTKKGTRGELAADRAKTEDMKEVLRNAATMYKELKALEKQNMSDSSVRLSRASCCSTTSLNHSPSKSGPHGLVEGGQLSPPMSPSKQSDLASLIEKINQTTVKLQQMARHDRCREAGHSNTQDVSRSDTGHSNTQDALRSDTGHSDTQDVSRSDTDHSNTQDVSRSDTSDSNNQDASRSGTGNSNTKEVSRSETCDSNTQEASRSDTGDHRGDLEDINKDAHISVGELEKDVTQQNMYLHIVPQCERHSDTHKTCDKSDLAHTDQQDMPKVETTI